MHNPLNTKDKDAKNLSSVPSITSDPVSSIKSSIERRCTRITSRTSLGSTVNPPSQTTQRSIFDGENRMGIVVEEPEPPYLILFVEEENSQRPLSYISLESKFRATASLSAEF